MTGLITSWLTAVGRNARLVLAVGAMAAPFAGPLSTALSPALPVLLVALYALAMTRIDPLVVLRDTLRPKAALRTLAISATMMVATPIVLFGLAHALDAGEATVAALVYFAVSPAISSAAALCFMVRADAALALQVTVFSGFLAPAVGPVVAVSLLGEAVPIDAGALALRLGAMIGAGLAIALIARRALTPPRIERNGAAFDGVAALTMLAFLIPLFDGVAAQVLDAPIAALATLALAVAANIGLQVATIALLRPRAEAAVAGSLAILMGNRNVSLYVAALPPDPVFALFVALYQYPMYFTPLIIGRLLRRTSQSPDDR